MYTRGDIVTIKAAEDNFRLALIINNPINGNPTFLIAPITSAHVRHSNHTHFRITANNFGLTQDSVILLDNLTTINPFKLMKRIGKVDDDTMEKVDLVVGKYIGIDQRESQFLGAEHAFYNNKSVVSLADFLRKQVQDAIPRRFLSPQTSTHFNYEQNDDTSFSLIDVIEQHKVIVLLAEAGAGKSIALKQLTYQLIEDRNNEYLPVFISLNTYVDEDISVLIHRNFGDLSKFRMENLLFIFDEFDQVRDKVPLVRKLSTFMDSHPTSKFCIASRTNSYSNHFPQAYVTYLASFSHENIYAYIAKVLPDDKDSLIQQITTNKYTELAQSPFFLNALIEFYKTNNTIPSKKTEIIELVITESIERKLAELEEESSIQGTYFSESIMQTLQKLALVMQISHKNYLSMTELQHVVPLKEERFILKSLDILSKRNENAQYIFNFQHNNYNEYLCACALKELPLEQLINFISYPELNIREINPAWTNVLSFLVSIRANDDLYEYLLEHDPEYILQFEVSRLSKEQRINAFKAILNKYSSRHIWLSINLSFSKLAELGSIGELFDYLLRESVSTEHYTVRYNSIVLLRELKGFDDSAFHEIIASHAQNKEENENVRELSIRSLGEFGKVSVETAQKILKSIDTQYSALMSGFYYMVRKAGLSVDFISTLLTGIAFIRTRFETTNDRLGNEGWELYDALVSVNNSPSIRTVIQYFSDNPYDLEEISLNDYVNKLVENAITVYKQDETLYEDMKQLLNKCHNAYLNKSVLIIRQFFVMTGTLDRLFGEYYNTQNFTDNCQLISVILDESSIEKVLSDHAKGLLQDQDIFMLLNFMSNRNRSYESIKRIIESHQTIKFPPMRDLTQEKKLKLSEQLSIIFNKEKLLFEIEYVFSQLGKEELIKDDLEFDSIYDKTTHDFKYKNYIVRELNNFVSHSPMSFQEIREVINSWNYDDFLLSRTYDVLYCNKDAELSKEQTVLIRDICFKNLPNVSFRTALNVDGTIQQSLATPIWYFMVRYNFTFPDHVLLDLISFDSFFESKGFLGVKYLEDLLGINKMTTRILDNLTNLNKFPLNEWVILNHIDVCSQHSLYASLQAVKLIVETQGYRTNVRKKALDLCIHLNVNIEYLLNLVRSTEDIELFRTASNELLERENEDIESVLILNMTNNNPFSSVSCWLLVKYKQNIDALNFYIQQVKNSGEFLEEPLDQSTLSVVNSVNAVDLLFELLLFCKTNTVTEHPFNRLEYAACTALQRIAIQNKENLDKVVSKLQEFVEQHITLKDINFLNVFSDNIVEAFKINFKPTSTVQAVIRNVNQLLNMPEDEVYRNKLAVCVQLQVEIINICVNKGTSIIYKNHPNMFVIVARLVRLPLSRDEKGFKDLADLLQQLFWEGLEQAQMNPGGYLDTTCHELYVVSDRIRCLRHHYYHLELNKAHVKQMIVTEFSNLGYTPVSSLDWTKFHIKIVDDLLTALLNAKKVLS